MNPAPPFSPERWEQTPIAVREYLRTLEARVAALEATVQPWLERLQQDAHNSSRPPSSDPPHAFMPGRIPGAACTLPRHTEAEEDRPVAA